MTVFIDGTGRRWVRSMLKEMFSPIPPTPLPPSQIYRSTVQGDNTNFHQSADTFVFCKFWLQIWPNLMYKWITLKHTCWSRPVCFFMTINKWSIKYYFQFLFFSFLNNLVGVILITWKHKFNTMLQKKQFCYYYFGNEGETNKSERATL